MEIETALKHIATMLTSRGDDVSDFVETAAGLDKATFYNELIALETNKTKLFFCLNKDTLKEFIKEIKDMDVDEIDEKWDTKQLIVVERPSQTSTAILEEKDRMLMAAGGYLQLFDIKYLQYNPAAHINTPHHEKISEVALKALLEQYQLKNKFQLPIIQRSDIMARWLGLRHGDVVKIVRHNDTSGTYDYYRCCM